MLSVLFCGVASFGKSTLRQNLIQDSNSVIFNFASFLNGGKSSLFL